MDYYHDLVTQMSWEELAALNKRLRFTLIGGWVVYLYCSPSTVISHRLIIYSRSIIYRAKDNHS
jgi:hypothetical protein